MKGGNRSNKVCTYYGRIGHIVEICFKKHGFPAHFKKNVVANNCAAEEDNSLESEDDTDSQEGGQGNNYDEAVFDFTPEQKKAILDILKQSNINQMKSKTFQARKVSPKTSQPSRDDVGNCNASSSNYRSSRWIIDSRATDHVCCSLDDFQSI